MSNKPPEPLNIPEIPRHHINIEDRQELDNLIHQVLDKKPKYVAFDTETTGLGPQDKVFAFSICLGGFDDLNYCVPQIVYFYRFDMNEEEDNDRAQDFIQALFKQQDTTIIFHNAKFDIKMVKGTFGIEMFSNYRDSMLIAEMFPNKYPKAGLKDLGQRVLKQTDRWDSITKKYIKQGLSFDQMPDILMYGYACMDAELTFNLFFVLRETFKQRPAILQQIYMLELQLAPIVGDMERLGAPIDLPYLEQLKKDAEEELDSSLAILRKNFGEKFNPGSPKQIGDVLYVRLGLPILKTTMKGSPSADSETIGLLVSKFPEHTELQRIANYSRLKHIHSTFLTSMVEKHVDHGTYKAVHTNYRQSVNTGRFSSSDINLQNMPNDSIGKTKGLITGRDASLRQAFIAAPDCVYLKFDYAGFELRIIANASQDSQMLEMLEAGIDLHSWLATKLYKLELAQWSPEQRAPYNKLREDAGDFAKDWGLDWSYFAITSKATDRLKYMRTVVKTCQFGIYYGIGAEKLSKQHKITMQEARELKIVCFTSFPKLNAWREEVNRHARSRLYIDTMCGRRVELDPLRVWTQSVNSIVQGTAADLLKYSMLEIGKLLKGTKSRLTLTIHDEVQVMLHKDEVHLAEGIIECLERRYLPEDVAPLPMSAEVSYSLTTWADMKDVPTRLLPQILKGVVEQWVN